MTEARIRERLGVRPRLEAETPEEKPAVSWDRRLRPVDWFTVAYLGVTLLLLLLRGSRIDDAHLLAGVHVLGIALIVAFRWLGIDRWRAGDLLLGFYPLVLFALFYTEVGVLNQLITPGVFHDSAILEIEEKVFRGQPSQELYRRLDSRLLGEYLHLGYFSYYFLVPILGFTLWFRRPREQFDRAVACIAFVFYSCFLIFIFYPVTGPYHVVTAPPPAEGVGYVLPNVTRWLLDRGSSVGTAFPSSHVAVAVVTWLMAIRYHTGIAVLYAFLVPALAVGAINGGYHYATDIVAGALLAD